MGDGKGTKKIRDEKKRRGTEKIFTSIDQFIFSLGNVPFSFPSPSPFLYFSKFESMFATNKLKPASGRLLIAEPFLHDDYFRRAVVLIADHSEKVTIGFILNKPLEITVQQAVPEFPKYDKLTYFGGPVQRDQLYFIHTIAEKIEDSFPIGNGLHWLGDFDKVKRLIEKKEITEDQIRFFIGYAGWEAGQLEKELESKSWFVSNPDNEIIFNVDPTEMWSTAVKKMGDAFAPMANFPEDPSLN